MTLPAFSSFRHHLLGRPRYHEQSQPASQMTSRSPRIGSSGFSTMMTCVTSRITVYPTNALSIDEERAQYIMSTSRTTFRLSIPSCYAFSSKHTIFVLPIDLDIADVKVTNSELRSMRGIFGGQLQDTRSGGRTDGVLVPFSFTIWSCFQRE